MKIFMVGGAVRDTLLGMEPKDRDFVIVGATVEELENQGFTKTVGADFPVFLKDGEEFALARTERKVGMGHTAFETRFDPSVTLEEDLMRRDLTINAMAQDPETGEIIDPFNGQQDLERGQLRHVSPAFSEDPLRVLRVARFAARFGFTVAPETLKLMTHLASHGELDSLTKERVWSEVSRAMMEREPQNFFRVLNSVGAMPALFGKMESLFQGTDQWLMRIGSSELNERQRWMAAFWDVRCEDFVEAFVKRMNMPNELRTSIMFAVSLKQVDWESAESVTEFMNRWKLGNNRRMMLEAVEMFSTMTTPDPTLESFPSVVAQAAQVNFDSLTEEQRNKLQGPEIGHAINELRQAVFQSWINELQAAREVESA